MIDCTFALLFYSLFCIFIILLVAALREDFLLRFAMQLR